MNEKLIKKLRKGTIALVNNGTLEELRKVLRYAFPNGKSKISGDCKYYFKSACGENIWAANDKTNLPTHYVKEFLNQKQEIMSTVVNINPDTSEINITPKEGFEIDIENSDLKNGKVLFKEVEKKYPYEFKYNVKRHGLFNRVKLSATYAEKLEILDTLLCLKDEYNRIDGFTEGFRFGKYNWCITNYNNQFYLSKWEYSIKIMHFGKEETGKLFLKNFKEQLETVKEFL